MNLIKNAFVYFAALPDAAAMTEHLEKLPHRPLGETERMRSSFIVNDTTGELVTPIENGYSFTYRRDEKILPAAAVNSELKDRVRAIEKEQGRKVGHKERADMKDQITMEMLRVALVKTTEIDAFYDSSRGVFVIATSSTGVADDMISDLAGLMDGIDARRIIIDDLHFRLTNKLREHLQSDHPNTFGAFEPGKYVQMKGLDGNKATFETDGQRDPTDGIEEAACAGCQVERIELMSGEFVFRLTRDFAFKSIAFGDTAPDDDEGFDDDMAGYWRHEAGVQMMMLTEAVDDLCKLFDHVATDAASNQAAAQEEEGAELA